MNDLFIETLYKTDKIKIDLYYDTFCNYLYDELWQDVTFISNHQDYNSIGPNNDVTVEDIIEEKGILNEFNVIEISAYIHSGIALYVGHTRPCKWDSGTFGFILIPKTLDYKFNAESFVNQWQMILNGEIYLITVSESIDLYTKNGELYSTNLEVADSIGGVMVNDRSDLIDHIKYYFNIDITREV